MRHGIKSKHFNRDTNNRKALLRELVTAVVQHGRVTTTVTKAKEIKRITDRLIHKAQTDTVATRRTLHQFFGKRDVVNTLVSRVAPAMSDRTSGFTRITALGNRRGDNADMVSLSLVTMPEVIGTLKSGQDRTAQAAKSTAKKTAAKKTAAKKVAPVKAKRQPDVRIQQQARRDEVQTGVKGNQPKVRRQAKTMSGK